MIRRIILLLFSLMFIASLPTGALASASRLTNEAPSPPELKVSISSEPSPLNAPGKGFLILSIEVPAGYHIFAGKDLSVHVPTVDGISFGEPVVPAGTKEEGFNILRGRPIVKIPLKVAKGLKGPAKGELTFGWQGCQDFGDKVCFLPRENTASFSLPIRTITNGAPNASSRTPVVVQETTGAAIASQTSTTAQTAGSSPASQKVRARSASPAHSWRGRFQRAAEHNLPLALLLAFIFGILSSLTPCVYPVIPITVAYIGSRSEGKRKAHGFLLSLAFVLGMAAVYSTLGAVSAKVGAAFGSLTQNPWVGVPIATLFLLLALSMFNLFELKTPAFLTNRIERTKHKTKGGGFFGAFLIGALSGLVVSPCIGPLILAILIVVAATGSVFLGFLYLFVFALGMGMLFVVIGSFSGVLASLPKSGTWMDGVRVFFGALILAAAFYFGGLYLPRPVYLLTSGIVLGFVTGFLAFGAQKHFFSRFLGTGGIILSAAALILVAFFLPPVQTAPRAPYATAGAWLSNIDAAFEAGRSQNKPVLLDFRANWCVACLELEKKTWPSPELKAALDKVVPVRLDMTKNTRANRNLLKRFKVMGLPTVILLTPGGRELGRFTGYKSKAAALEWLDRTMGAP